MSCSDANATQVGAHMDFEIVNGDIASLETECLIIAVEADTTLSPAAKLADEASSGYIS